MFATAIKNFIKKHFYILKVGNKLAPSVQIGQVQLYHHYQTKKEQNKLPKFNETGFKNFSQFEEDGLLLYIFSVIGMGSKSFVDLGSNDCVNSNCANLAIHFGWLGLFVDGDKTMIKIGKKFYSKYPNPWNHPQQFSCSFITEENVNSLMKNKGIEGEIELLSIDIDGNDFWIWKAIEVIQPKVVVIESQVAFGDKNLVVPYIDGYNSDIKSNYYSGASTIALQKLGKEKGYRLIGSNQYGHNLFFMKNGVGDHEFPEINALQTLQHPFATSKFHEFEKIKHLPFTSA